MKKTQIQLFNLFIKKEPPNFSFVGINNVAFCWGKACHDCHIRKECRETSAKVPKLTLKQYKNVSKKYPEYMI